MLLLQRGQVALSQHMAASPSPGCGRLVLVDGISRCFRISVINVGVGADIRIILGLAGVFVETRKLRRHDTVATLTAE